MSKRKIIIYTVLGILILILAAFVYYRINENLKSSQKQRQQVQFIKIINPVREDISSRISLSGDIIASQQTAIYSRVTGNIQKMYADVGDFVGQGKLLATIDKSQFVQSLRQTQAILLQYQANYENSKINFERTATLFEKGLSSQSDYDNAFTQMKVNEAQIESGEASVQNAMLQISYCNITAPFSGYITKRFLDAGALVSSGTTNSIFLLSDINDLKIMVNIPEKNLSSIEYITDVKITTDAYPDRTFEGIFKKISQSFDLATRTMQAEIRVDNKNNILKPGMFAKIEILLEKHSDALVLPEQCVRKDDKGSFVFVVSDENVAKRKEVQTGINSNNKIEIISGLNENEKVVFVGQELINDNSKVQIIQ